MSNLSISITEYKNGLEDSNKLPIGYWMGVQVGRTDGYMVKKTNLFLLLDVTVWGEG